MQPTLVFFGPCIVIWNIKSIATRCRFTFNSTIFNWLLFTILRPRIIQIPIFTATKTFSKVLEGSLNGSSLSRVRVSWAFSRTATFFEIKKNSFNLYESYSQCFKWGKTTCLPYLSIKKLSFFHSKQSEAISCRQKYFMADHVLLPSFSLCMR